MDLLVFKKVGDLFLSLDLQCQQNYSSQLARMDFFQVSKNIQAQLVITDSSHVASMVLCWLDRLLVIWMHLLLTSCKYLKK